MWTRCFSKIPWYLVDNLLEKLYLKYHKTKIHKCFDIVHKYLLDDYDNADNARGIYVFWKEMEELWDEVDDEKPYQIIITIVIIIGIMELILSIVKI